MIDGFPVTFLARPYDPRAYCLSFLRSRVTWAYLFLPPAAVATVATTVPVARECETLGHYGSNSNRSNHWTREAGSRVKCTRDLDSGKVQGPCVVKIPAGGYRLYYTGVGAAKPFPQCQG